MYFLSTIRLNHWLFSHTDDCVKNLPVVVLAYCLKAPQLNWNYWRRRRSYWTISADGVAMVEFKVAADGTPYLMEINTRFWGSLQLAVDAGVDFPYMLYKLACDEQPETVTDYKTGLTLRWLLGDLDNLYLTLRNRKLPMGKKLSALGRFILPTSVKTLHKVNRWSDFGPFWWELKQYIRDL